MKRRSTWARMLCAALCLLLCSTACAAPGDAALLRAGSDFSDALLGMFSAGGALYVQGESALYRYHPGDGAPAAYTWDESLSSERLAFAAGDDPQILVREEGGAARLGALALENGVARTAALREIPFPDEIEALRPQGCAAVGGFLYLLCFDGRGTALWSLELESAEWSRLPFAEPQFIAPSPDGALYVLESGDALSLWRADDGAEALCKVDTAALGDSIADIENAISGLACDPSSGALYCVGDNRLHPLDTDSGALGDSIAALPAGNSVRAARIVDGLYACICAQAMFIRALERPDAPAQTLTVYDASHQSAVTQACLDLSDVEVNLTRDAREQEKLIENMLSGDRRIDVYLLYAQDSAYAELYARGYMAELDSPRLAEFVSRMYPGVRERAFRGDALVALPVSASRWGLGVNLSALTKLGLSTDALPGNWSDFFKFLNALPAKLEGTGVTAFESGLTAENLRAQLLQQMLGDFLDGSSEMQGAPIADIDALQRAMEALEAVDFAALGCAEGGDAQLGMVAASGGGGFSYGGEALFLLGAGGCFGAFTPGVEPLLLAPDAESPAVMALDVAMAFVNPYSERPELARRYLEALAAALPPESLYNFAPGLTAPVEGDGYRARLDELSKDVAYLELALDAAEAIDRPAVEAELIWARERLEDYRENGLAIAQPQIDWFRAHDEHLCVSPRDWLFSDGGEAAALVQRYLSGELPLPQFLSALAQKLQISHLEAAASRR